MRPPPIRERKHCASRPKSRSRNPLLAGSFETPFIDSLVFDEFVLNRITGSAPQLTEAVPTAENGGIS